MRRLLIMEGVSQPCSAITQELMLHLVRIICYLKKIISVVCVCVLTLQHYADDIRQVRQSHICRR
jgi:hypothetical protein